jgi:hypothetical protein
MLEPSYQVVKHPMEAHMHWMTKLGGAGICLVGMAVRSTVNEHVGHAIFHFGMHLIKH